MRITIDRAGRVVIPAAIRARASLTPGTELEVVLEGTSVRLVRAVPGPTLVKLGGRLVARPSVPPDQLPDVDVARLVEEERDRWPW
jgi:AbrB family looped-hinge helix DNA binding protein